MGGGGCKVPEIFEFDPPPRAIQGNIFRINDVDVSMSRGIYYTNYTN